MPDLTDYRNHGTVAKGGKVTRIVGDPWREQAAPVVPANTVKNALMRIMYESATDPNRPRVQGGASAKSTEPLHNDKHHFVGMSILELSKRATAVMGKHVGQHEVVHALFDLRGQQLVKFHTSKSQGNASRRETDMGAGMGGSTPYGGIPVRLQLTAKGLEEGARLMKPIFGPPPVATDDPVPVPVIQSERAEPIVPDHTPEPEAEAGPPEIKVTEQAFGRPLFRINGYPEIIRASQAEQRVREAANLLKLAGHDTLADMALAELAGRTALEAEVAKLIAQLNSEGILVLEQEGGEQEG